MFQAILTGATIRQIIATAEFAHTNNDFPALYGVHLVTRGDSLVIEATDRYVLIETTIPTNVEGTPLQMTGEVDTIIPLDAVKTWKTLTTSAQARRETFVLEVEESTWRLKRYDGSTTTGTVSSANFPPIGRLFPDPRTVLPWTGAMNSGLLEKLAKHDKTAGRTKEGGFWHFGASRPGVTAPVIALTEGSRALVMPARTHTDIVALHGYTVEES